MKFDDIHIAIISHKRPNNVTLMENITGIGEKLYWYVGIDEVKEYTSRATGMVIEGGDLTHSRNCALKDANIKGKYCLMLDDDLVKIHQFLTIGQTEISFELMVKQMYEILHSIPLHLAGISATTNRYFYHPEKPLSLKHFIIASCMMSKYPTEVFFDTQFQTKEDYDLTLQHIQKYGGVARINYLAPQFKHYTNRGGVVDTRCDEVEQDSIQKLIKKWGNSIKPNTRRGKNEILLKIK